MRSHTVIIRAAFPSPGTKAPLTVETTCQISLLDQCVTAWNTTHESGCSDDQGEGEGEGEVVSRTLTVSAASLRCVFPIPVRSGIPDGAFGVLMDRDGGRTGVVRVLAEDHAQCDTDDHQQECTKSDSEEQDIIPVKLTVCHFFMGVFLLCIWLDSARLSWYPLRPRLDYTVS